jgi:Tfp pilus assembly protein PilN
LRPLNLASRPFRNERLPALLSAIVALIVLAATVAHALAIVSVLPTRLGRIEGQRRELEAELNHLGQEGEKLRALRPSKEDLTQWGILRELVDRRLFQWSVLLAQLSQILPPDIRLTTIEPTLSKGTVELRLGAKTGSRGSGALLGFARRLEEQPEFEGVAPESVDEDKDGSAASYRMRYVAQPPPPSASATEAAPPSPAPEPSR